MRKIIGLALIAIGLKIIVGNVNVYMDTKSSESLVTLLLAAASVIVGITLFSNNSIITKLRSFIVYALIIITKLILAGCYIFMGYYLYRIFLQNDHSFVSSSVQLLFVIIVFRIVLNFIGKPKGKRYYNNNINRQRDIHENNFRLMEEQNRFMEDHNRFMKEMQDDSNRFMETQNNNTNHFNGF